MEQQTVFIGWDVGGWNCDNNANSRDALVLLDAHHRVLGIPWRGNLAYAITGKIAGAEVFEGLVRLVSELAGEKVASAEPNQEAFLSELFALCDCEYQGQQVVLAIDTPLGFSQYFRRLLDSEYIDFNGPSSHNPYLFRETERFLANNGFQPLSAIKDMIGSQATKGMHVVAKYAPSIASNGVWQQGALTIIEAYPSPCKQSALIEGMHKQCQLGDPSPSGEYRQLENGKKVHDDHTDALTCAFIAWLWQQQPDSLISPPEDIPANEGWIFVPKDCFDGGQMGRKNKMKNNRIGL